MRQYINLISSNIDLAFGKHQAIIWTSVGMLLIWNLGRNVSEIISKIWENALSMSSAK